MKRILPLILLLACTAAAQPPLLRIPTPVRVDLYGVPDRWVEIDGHRMRYVNTTNPYNLDDFWFMLGTTEGQSNLLGLSRDRADATLPGTVVVGSGALATAAAPFHGGGFLSIQGKYYANGSGDQDLNFRLRTVLSDAAPTGRLSLTVDQAYPKKERELARFSNDGSVLFYGQSLEVQGPGTPFLRLHEPGVGWNILRTGNNEVWVQKGDGSGWAPVRASAYLTPSSRSLKSHIRPYTGGISAVMRMRAATFDYIAGPKNQVGFIAEELAAVLPQATDAKHSAVDYSKIIPVLVQAIQEQQRTIAALQAKIK